mmetsp:Transcript_9879/g.17373  ORF Transcript_9879/g.17373 Transcript_9879/m.17373 type:complete len:558 (+) Transcript_9879:404-2077(+)
MARAAPSGGPAFLDSYEVIETIGRGSFGEVIKVRRRADQKELVCKVLRYGSMKEKERRLVVSEVNILRELRHPHIVRYYDRVVDKRSAKLYIVMEYCEGGDLGRHIKRKRRTNTCFEEARIWRALAQLLSALEECHLREEKGSLRPILHRDVKPCNIFLDRLGNVKLGDFGLAKELGEQDQFATTNVGTPYYMSPELINEKRYNDKSDIWSIGCLIYEMAALRPPFEALNVVSLGRKISAGRFARIPSRYSQDLQGVIEDMLTLNPNRRPSVRELLTHKLISLHTRRAMARPHLRRESPSTTPNAQECSPRKPEKSSGDTCLDEYLAKRFAELNKREEELAHREAALKSRERRVLQREELVNRREQSLLDKPSVRTPERRNRSGSSFLSVRSPASSLTRNSRDSYQSTTQESVLVDDGHRTPIDPSRKRLTVMTHRHRNGSESSLNPASPDAGSDAHHVKDGYKQQHYSSRPRPESTPVRRTQRVKEALDIASKITAKYGEPYSTSSSIDTISPVEKARPSERWRLRTELMHYGSPRPSGTRRHTTLTGPSRKCFDR